jgi:hypothetical protein
MCLRGSVWLAFLVSDLLKPVIVVVSWGGWLLLRGLLLFVILVAIVQRVVWIGLADPDTGQ